MAKKETKRETKDDKQEGLLLNTYQRVILGTKVVVKAKDQDEASKLLDKKEKEMKKERGEE